MRAGRRGLPDGGGARVPREAGADAQPAARVAAAAHIPSAEAHHPAAQVKCASAAAPQSAHAAARAVERSGHRLVNIVIRSPLAHSISTYVQIVHCTRLGCTLRVNFKTPPERAP